MSTLRRRMMMVAREHGVPSDEIWYYAAEKVTLYNSTGVVSHEFANGKGVIKFSSNVTSVGQQLRGTAINNVELPSGVTSIVNYAFYNCTRLALISLPSGVTRIRGNAFQNCTSLALTSLPSGVTSIDGAVFSNCTSLALTSLPSGVTSIGNSTFYRCTGITGLIIPIASPPSLGVLVFEGTTFPIYVPSESLEAYKSAVNWSSYASRIFPIS